MLRAAFTIFAIYIGTVVSAHAQKLQFAAESQSSFKLYCASIANVKNRRKDLHYKIRACLADSSPCSQKWKKRKLEYRGRRSTASQSFCVLERNPVKMFVAYDQGLTHEYVETIQELVPQTFQWRERWPDIGCVRHSVYRFAPFRGQP